MALRSLKKIRNLTGKRVLLRVDFNVPINRGKVLEDTRLMAAIPTIEYLVEKGAKVIIATHIGRPDGAVVRSLRVDPVIKRLAEITGKKIKKIDTKHGNLKETAWEKIVRETKALRPGQIAMIENTRFSPDEKSHSGVFAAHLASLADVFVQDCFAVAHRSDASVVGPSEHLPSYAGFLLLDEIAALDKVTKKPKKPFVAVMGGAKLETKIPVIKNLLPKVSHLLIGGGIVNTSLWAQGYRVGDSLVDKAYKKDVLSYCKSKKVVHPVDVVVGDIAGTHYRVELVGERPRQICKKGEAILDIGPQTIRLYATVIKKAQTLVWNGAMGLFEQPPYDVGTLAIARLVASRSKGTAFGVIGGGETLQAMELVGMGEYVDLVSTGGGAMLEYLAGKKLPGIEALK